MVLPTHGPKAFGRQTSSDGQVHHDVPTNYKLSAHSALRAFSFTHETRYTYYT